MLFVKYRLTEYNVVRTSFLLRISLYNSLICGAAVNIYIHYNGRDSVSNHQPHDGLLNLLFRRRSKKTSKFRVTGQCAGNSPLTGEFPAQMASNAEYVSIWWRHHGIYGSHSSTSIKKIDWLNQLNICIHLYALHQNATTTVSLTSQWATHESTLSKIVSISISVTKFEQSMCHN